MSIMRTVVHTRHFRVITHACQRPRVDCGYGQGNEPSRFIFTRRGAFAMHVGSRTCFARPGSAVFMRKHVEYRVSHPDAHSCDCCTDVWVADAMLDSLGLAGRKAPSCQAFGHDLGFQKLHVEMLLGLQRDDGETDDVEEVMFDALGYLLQSSPQTRTRMRGDVAARRVARVEEAIIGHAGENLDIHALAALACCSPFHLCRIFRACTGQSLRQFRLQQRLGTALGRLGEGEDDLAALACDLGFSSHSHMTAAFRDAFGTSPRMLRDELRRSSLRRLGVRLRTLQDMQVLEKTPSGLASRMP